MRKAIEALKALAALVVSFGVGAVAENLIGLAAGREKGKLIKATMWIGGFVIAGLAAAAAEAKVEEALDGVVESVDTYLQERNEEDMEEEDQETEEEEECDNYPIPDYDRDGEEA